MTSVFDDIRNTFNGNRNSSTKVILINVFVFLGLGIFQFFFSLSEETRFLVAEIKNNVWLNADAPGFLLHPWGLLSFGFVNNGFFDLLFNAIALFYFGLLLQDFLGTKKLTNIYLLGYLFTGIFYVIIYNMAQIWQVKVNLAPQVAGASTAVYAVIFAAVTLLPDYEFYFFRLFYIKIKYFAIGLLVLSFLLAPNQGLLHIGGAAFGYLYIKLLRSGVDLASPIDALVNFFKPRKPTSPTRSSKKYSHSTVGTSRKSSFEFKLTSEPDQDEVDALLDKISVHGYNSLTKEEKERLLEASKSTNLRTR